MNRRTRPSACCAEPARLVPVQNVRESEAEMRNAPMPMQTQTQTQMQMAPACFEDGGTAAPLLSLAIMTVPFQRADFARVYSPEEALGAGTLFTELELPFLGCGR